MQISLAPLADVLYNERGIASRRRQWAGVETCPTVGRLSPAAAGWKELEEMAVSEKDDVSRQAKSMLPEFAEKMRRRRPGYDRVFELTQQYKDLPSNKRAQMTKDDVAYLFVRPMFEALGWTTSAPPVMAEDESPPFDLELEYRDLHVSVEVRGFGDSLSSYSGKGFYRWEILTNFETILVWDSRDPSQPVIRLETDPWSYIAGDREEDDLLAARVFYERLVQPIRGFTGADRPEPRAQATVSPEPAAPPDLGAYAEGDGPRRRFEEVMAGISFGSADTAAATITALVTDRESGKPLLLLPGWTLPPGTEIIQPGRAHGGNDQDKIGVVEREVFNETCVAAIARPEGERTFLSTLPNGRAVAGVAEPAPGLRVCKFGEVSGYTQSEVTQIDVGVRLEGDTQREIMLRNCFLVPEFSSPGDLGALVVTVDTNQAVGVIAGGNEEITVCLPIRPVLDELGVELVTRPVRYIRAQRPTDRITATTDLVGGEDRLGFTHYVDAFVRLIEDTQPPLTIGIYGAWGTGKSFLMDKIAKRLKPEGDVKQVEKLSLWQKIFRPSKTQMPVVWFEAWDYNASDKLWAGLVERIFLSIENSGLGWYGQLRIDLKRNLERRWRELRSKFLPYTLIAIVVAALTLGFVLTNQDAWARAIGGSTALVLLVSLIRQLVGVFGTSASQRIVDLFATPDYRADIGFMGRIKRDLEGFANSLPKGMKVVVFIDDLDRCDPKKAVEVLEAIKLLLDFERFIVFLALDARIITQAVEEHYGKVLTEAEITGYEYLDKIVQIPFSIPEPPPRELRRYIGSLVGLSEADIPPIEPMTVGQEEKEKEEEPPPEFVEEPAAPKPEAMEQTAEASSPSEAVAAPAEGAEEPVSAVQPPAAAAPPEPSDEEQMIEDVLDTSVVTFTRPEQQAILAFYSHLDPNPRRIKRVVNIYRLVRALIASRQQTQKAGEAPDSPVLPEPENPRHILGWLILCEQWPYAAHMMLEVLNQSLKGAAETRDRPLTASSSVMQLYEVAQKRIAQEENEALKKLDLKYDRLRSLIETHLYDFTLADLQRLRPYTVNFNPALSAEVRLTLSRGG